MTPQVGPPGSADRIRLELRRCDFTSHNIRKRLGLTYPMWSKRSLCRNLIIDEYKKSPIADGVDILIRLLVLNMPIHITLIKQVISNVAINDLVLLSIITYQLSDKLSSEFSMFECDGLYILTDKLVVDNLNDSYVMPIIEECYELLSSIPKQWSQSTLDLCTGSGIYAIASARHSGLVTGIDNNPRAIHFSKFNSWLNGINSITFRLQDFLLTPLTDTFDLILANPPYIPCGDNPPGSNFYNGGPNGDSISSVIVRNLPMWLKRGGICKIIHMMICFNNEDYTTKLRTWLGNYANDFSISIQSDIIDSIITTPTKPSSTRFGIVTFTRISGGSGS